jgi:hypothetical protein
MTFYSDEIINRLHTLFDDGLKDNDISLTKELLFAFGELNVEQAVPKLKNFIIQGSDPSLQIEAIAALSKITNAGLNSDEATELAELLCDIFQNQRKWLNDWDKRSLIISLRYLDVYDELRIVPLLLELQNEHESFKVEAGKTLAFLVRTDRNKD